MAMDLVMELVREAARDANVDAFAPHDDMATFARERDYNDWLARAYGDRSRDADVGDDGRFLVADAGADAVSRAL